MQEIMLGLLLLMAIGWLVLRLRRGRTDVKAPTRAKSLKDTSPYHAVSIKFAENACGAAKAMAGRRFLSNAAPRLPLPECDALECRCAFVHHADRRSGKDRRSPFATAGYAASGTGSFKKERRERRDRRKDDDEGFRF